MSVLDRVGKMVRSEWNARRPHFSDRAKPEHAPGAFGTTPPSTAPPRKPAVLDVEGARRVLELSSQATLDEVRAQYRALARRYYPKTLSPKADEAHAARAVLEALTDALELLEAHLLPLPPESPRPPAGRS